MKKSLILATTAIAAAAALRLYAQGPAQAAAPTPAQPNAAAPQPRFACPGCGMMRRRGPAAMMPARGFQGGPAGIACRAAALGLSEEQKAKLLAIQKEARKKALAVLTPEQRKKLEKLQPMAMMQGMPQAGRGMRGMMMQRRMGRGMMMRGRRGGKMRMRRNCGMCPMMLQGAAGPATPPAPAQ